MCGITGILYPHHRQSVPENLLFRMMGQLRHRGPDESGAYFGEGVSLGHTRLSIIGLDDGIQPMANGDGSLWIVYNGETFNYLELRGELQRKGHRFATATDTEVVLRLYEEFGAAGLERINGQFALAIWDARRRELFLARDRVGIRPLYYTRQGGRFLFASEIKALLADPSVSRELDPFSLAQTFTFWTTLTPRSIFRQIREIPAGCWMRVGDRGEETGAWWTIPAHPPEEGWKGSFHEAREELASLLHDAVRLQLRADVPVGCYLSGGLDSSIVATLAADLRGERGLHTFSMGFEENAFDEAPFQQQMVRRLGTDHSQVQITNTMIREHFARTVWHCERPVLRTAPVPLLHLSQLARESGFKVVLTGEGADELFGGYNIFKEEKVRRFWARQPRSTHRPLLLERLYPYVFRNPARGRLFLQQFFAVTGEDLSDPLLSHRRRWENGGRNLLFLSQEMHGALEGYDPRDELQALLPDGFAARGNLERAQWLEMSIFMSNYLLSSQGDRVAMANSLELRHPFLDARVIEFAARLPAHWKIRGLREKHILKEAFRGRVPEGIGNRPKQPYRAPVREVFFAKRPDPLLAHLLTEEALREGGLFHPERVGRLVGKFLQSPGETGNENQNMAITGILSTQLLHHHFVRRDGATQKECRPDHIVRACGGFDPAPQAASGPC